MNPAHLLSATLLLTGACRAQSDAEAGPSERSCTLGTGSTLFEPLHSGDSVGIVYGPQGGFHVWGTYRATGIDPGDYYDTAAPDNPTSIFNVYLSDHTRVGGSAPIRLGLKVRSDGTMEHVGEPVILGISDPEEIAYATATITVEVVDANGDTVTDERDVVLVPE
ncbi:MAG: hypothetical protein V3V08_06465 [Nannocystaceae bacterium]